MIKLKLTYKVIYEVDPNDYSEKNLNFIAGAEQDLLQVERLAIPELSGIHTITVAPFNLCEDFPLDLFRGMELPGPIANQLANAYFETTGDTVGASVIRECAVNKYVKGMFNKFSIARNDGKPADGEYFVLDMKKDPHARRAVLEYAKGCANEYPMLAADIEAKYGM